MELAAGDVLVCYGLFEDLQWSATGREDAGCAVQEDWFPVHPREFPAEFAAARDEMVLSVLMRREGATLGDASTRRCT